MANIWMGGKYHSENFACRLIWHTDKIIFAQPCHLAFPFWTFEHFACPLIWTFDTVIRLKWICPNPGIISKKICQSKIWIKFESLHLGSPQFKVRHTLNMTEVISHFQPWPRLVVRRNVNYQPLETWSRNVSNVIKRRGVYQMLHGNSGDEHLPMFSTFWGYVSMGVLPINALQWCISISCLTNLFLGQSTN